MLALEPANPPLGSAEQFGLDLLLDLSRILRFVGDGNVVHLRVVGDGESIFTIDSCIAHAWYIERSDGIVAIRREVLRLVTEIAGAVREQHATSYDRSDRVPSATNHLVESGYERVPVLSFAATELRRAVVAVAARRPVRLLAPWPHAKRWAVALSHDLDVVAKWPVFTALRIAELARKGALDRVRQVVLAAIKSAGRDPVWTGIQVILEAERARNVRSTWFILCGTPTLATMRAGDLTYLPESPAARRILSALATAGHDIELHGSFETLTSAERFAAQRSRLAAITGSAPSGVRQHYLRMRPGVTQRAQADAGFLHDSTFGFADRNGFRLGVADVVPLWNAADQSPLNIDEVPFAWMDRALSKYRGIESPIAWIDDAMALAAVVRAVEGLWCGIWHPNLVPALGFPEAPPAYARLVNELAAENPFFETTSSIVSWRRARRAASATALDADGSAIFGTHEPAAPFRLVLEDSQGRAFADRPTTPA